MILIKLKVKGYITTQMRRIRNYYFSITNYIPSTTLRGAILAEYYNQTGKIDENFYVSPAYPIKTAPAHYFSPAKERKGDEFIEVKRILEKKEKEFEANKPIEEIMKLEIDGKHPKPKIGSLITYEGETDKENKYREFSSKSIIQMHVAIDKTSISSYKGMLFAYEYKEFDEMWAIASDSEVIDTVKRIKIGRGKNRGNKVVDVEKVREVSLDQSKGLLYCLSPCIGSLFGKTFFKAKYIIGDKSIYSGWFTVDSFSGQKPVFETLREGSLVYVESFSNEKSLMPAGLNFMLRISDLSSIL
nr:Chain M, CRISPR-associated protein Cas5 (Type III-D) [Saccharolobus solfataricus]